jgi:H+/Cl- antiporter ClcA
MDSLSASHRVKLSFYAAITGVMAGVAATLFLVLLKWATDFRVLHPQLIYGLPLAGLCIGLIYHHFGREVSAGTNLIIDEFHSPQKVIPARMAPFVLLTTLLTHLFGGSAGREGTVVQMGASLADQLGSRKGLSKNDRKTLLLAGAGAGFGAALGAPIAGIFFGLEFIRFKGIYFFEHKLFGLWECALASLFAFLCTWILRAPHSVFAPIHLSLGIELFTPWTALLLAGELVLASAIFGGVARVFLVCVHHLEKIQAFVKYPPLRPVLAGLILVALYEFFSWQAYAGLSLPLIYQSFLPSAGAPLQAFLIPSIKLLLTVITIGSGFKGGEFIPLVVIGSTLGAALATLDPQLHEILPHLGFCAIFAAASKTPFSCAIMGCELFGWQFAPVAIIGCFVSSFTSGKTTLYSPKSTGYYNFKVS